MSFNPIPDNTSVSYTNTIIAGTDTATGTDTGTNLTISSSISGFDSLTTSTTNTGLIVSGTGTTTGNVVWNGTLTNVDNTYIEKYYLWGETLEVEKSSWIVSYNNNEKYTIAQLECMGTKYWESLKSNNIESDLNEDFYKQIDEAYKRKKRSENIKDVLDD